MWNVITCVVYINKYTSTKNPRTVHVAFIILYTFKTEFYQLYRLIPGGLTEKRVGGKRILYNKVEGEMTIMILLHGLCVAESGIGS